MAESSTLTLRTRETSADDLQKLVDKAYLYAIVDSCVVPAAAQKASEFGPEQVLSLYRGSGEEEFWDVAPYLFRVDKRVLQWIRSIATKPGWGVFLLSRSEMEFIRRHLRHFLKVQEPEGQIWLFRFYDPRVLVPFLPSCTKDELRVFYGPVIAYGTTTADGKSVIFVVESDDVFARQQPSPSYPLMFRLRDPHVAALEEQWTVAFAEEVIDFLRAKHGSLVANLSHEELRRRVRIGLKRAERYKFERQASLAAFVALMFRVAPNFDEQPAIRAVLMDEGIPPDYRMDRFRHRTHDQDWDEALLHADHSVWNS